MSGEGIFPSADECELLNEIPKTLVLTFVRLMNKETNSWVRIYIQLSKISVTAIRYAMNRLRIVTE